ncbi:MAG: TetR/AcrR family transcriptional regulator, partial [Acutalibacteraceae bacterium]
MSKAEYRSSIRSKTLIRQAFTQLINEKEFKKITVTDIVNRAGINRGTFYAHYEDIDALFESMENELVSILYSTLTDIDYSDLRHSLQISLAELSDMMQNEMPLFKILFVRTSAEPFVEKLQQAFVEFMQNNSKISSDTRKSEQFRFRAYFFAGGIVNIYRAWFRGDMNCRLEELAPLLEEII